MKIYLSHASKDVNLAYPLAQQLRTRGFSVWVSDEEITPGDNWAKKTGKALDESELMVILLTAGAMKSDRVRRDIEYAIGSMKFKDRVYSVFVGSKRQAAKDTPSILLKLPHRQVESADDFVDVAQDILTLSAALDKSHSHA